MVQDGGRMALMNGLMVYNFLYMICLGMLGKVCKLL